VSDVDSYVIIRKLLDSIFNIFPAFIRQWEIHIERMICLHKYDVPWFVVGGGGYVKELNNVLLT
jgi:hypothetical protein